MVPVPKVIDWGTVMNSSVLWNIVNNPIPNYCKYIILQGNYFYNHYDLINLELELVVTIPCCTGVTLHISSPGKDKKGCFSEICVVKWEEEGGREKGEATVTAKALKIGNCLCKKEYWN